MIDAKEAHRLGLVNAVVPQSDLIANAETLARKIVEKSGMAVRLCLDSVLQGMEMSQSEALANEASLLGRAATTEDAMEGMTAFLEKRKPVFKHK